MTPCQCRTQPCFPFHNIPMTSLMNNLKNSPCLTEKYIAALTSHGHSLFDFVCRCHVCNQHFQGIQCKELTLPPSDLAHSAARVCVLAASGDGQPTACVAVSPEGVVRYWPNIAYEASTSEISAELKGEECACVVHFQVSCTLYFVNFQVGCTLSISRWVVLCPLPGVFFHFQVCCTLSTATWVVLCPLPRGSRWVVLVLCPLPGGLYFVHFQVGCTLYLVHFRVGGTEGEVCTSNGVHCLVGCHCVYFAQTLTCGCVYLVQTLTCGCVYLEHSHVAVFIWYRH